ncbi:MAG: toxin-antitoxin system YwqK family antitoxin [Bacteroidota bacterium]
MPRVFIVLIIVFFTGSIHSQDTINLTGAYGRKEGFWRKTDSTGQKIYEGNFVAGIPTGEFRYFYKDGSLKTSSVVSQKGKRAVTVSYFPNGKKLAAGNYLNEKKDSLWQFFSDITGSLVSEDFYKDGKIEGKSKVYYPEGGMSELKNYKQGIPDGIWEQYFSDGKIKLRGAYKAGEKQGAFKTFSLAGRVTTSGQYKNGHQDGQWIYYDEEGAVIKKETFRNGMLLKTDEPAKK